MRNAYVAGLRLWTFAKQRLDRRFGALLHLSRWMLLLLPAAAYASVIINSVSASTSSGTATGGVLNVSMTYSVQADTPPTGDAIKTIELREGSNALATINYPSQAGASPIYNTVRNDTITAGLVPGQHYIYLRAYSEQGYVGDTGTFPVYVAAPNQRPTVHLTSPSGSVVVTASNGAYTLPVQGYATDPDNNVVRMRALVDGAPGAPVAGSTFNGSVTLGYGTFIVGLQAEDSEGASDSTGVFVFVNRPPNVSLTAPLANAVIRTQGTATTAAVRIQGTASDTDDFLARLEIWLDGSKVESLDYATSYDRTFDLALGQHSIELRAYDNYGVATTTSVVPFTVESSSNSAPSIVLVKPTAGLTINQQPYALHFEANASDADGNLASVKFYAKRNDGVVTEVGSGTLVGGVYVLDASIATLPAGSYQLYAIAKDALGAETTSTSVPLVVNNLAPVVSLQALHNNVALVQGYSAANVTFKGTASNANGQLTKLELFSDSGRGYDATPIRDIPTSGSGSVSINESLSIGPGTYRFKLRATDNQGGVAESSPVYVNIVASNPVGNFQGAVNGVRFDGQAKPELIGWACQSNVSTALNVQLYVNAPASLGGTLIGSGRADLSEEVDNEAIQIACGTPGVGHRYRLDLSPYTSSYAGSPIFVQALAADSASSIVLPCEDNTCTMPGSLSIALAAPANNDRYTAPGNVFAKAKLANGTGPYDAVEFFFDNGTWVAGQPDTAADTYYASASNLPARTAQYRIQARVRQGTTTVYTPESWVYVDSGSANGGLTWVAPNPGATYAVGANVDLAARFDGDTSNISVVKFTQAGNPIGEASQFNGTWRFTWKAVPAGTFGVIAQAYDRANAVVATTNTLQIIVGGTAASDSTPLPVNIAVPYLSNPDAGTLPGNLGVGANGAATYSIPLSVPPGTAGMAPSLSFNYSSQSSNGMLGLGWSLGGLSTIHRCNKTIAQDGAPGRISFDQADRLCLDGQRLILVNQGSNANDADYWSPSAEYRTEIDTFSRITAVAGTSGRAFKVETKAGQIMYYGADAASYIAAKGRDVQGQALVWALGRVEDRKGNYQTFEYSVDNTTGEYLPKQIRYGGNSNAGQSPDLAVRFQYTGRADAQTQYMGGARNDLRSLLTGVQAYIGTAADGSGGTLVRQYNLNYLDSATSGRKLLNWVELSALNLRTNAFETLPRTTFNWGQGSAAAYGPEPAITLPYYTDAVTGDNATYLRRDYSGNFDGSGRPTFISAKTIKRCGANGAQLCTPDLPDEEKTAHAILTGDVAFVVPGSTTSSISKFFSVDASFPVTQLMVGDLNGDGLDDLVLANTVDGFPVQGYCLNTTQSGAGISFDCRSWQRNTTSGATSPLPALVDVRNDRKAHLVFPLSTITPAEDCAFDTAANNLICQLLTAVNQTPAASGFSDPFSQPSFQPRAINFSKQDVSDFYSVWENPSHTKAGVTVCTNRGTIGCQTVIEFSRNISDPSSVPLPTIKGASAVGDLNGDGLTDFAFSVDDLSTTHDTYVCLSTESGVDCKLALSLPDGQDQSIATGVADYQGDGSTQLLLRKNLCRYLNGQLQCQPLPALPPGVDSQYGAGEFHDLYGTGVPSIVFPTAGDAATGTRSTAVFNLAGDVSQDRIVSVQNGIGQVEQADYARGDDFAVYRRYAQVSGVDVKPVYPQVSAPAGVMVKQLRRANGQGGWLAANQYYEGAMADALGRGSLGFTTKQVTDSQTGIAASTRFNQTWPLVAMASSATTKSSAGTVLSTTTSVPNYKQITQANGAKTYFPYVDSQTGAKFDLDGSAMGVSSVSNVFDDWGNLTSNTSVVGNALNAPVLTTITTNAMRSVDLSHWLVGLVDRTSVSKQQNTDSTPIVRTKSFTYEPDFSGQVKTETIQPDDASLKLKVVSTYTHGNAFGQITGKSITWRDPATGQDKTVAESIGYDAKGRFATSSTNALNQTESRSYDAATGAQLSLTDRNQLVSTMEVDAFGRLRRQVQPDGNEVRQSQKQCDASCPTNATVVTINSNWHGSDQISVPALSFADSAGHVLRTQTWGFDGTPIVVDNYYDDRGRLVQTDQPRFDGTGAPSYIAKRISLFDDLDRALEIYTLDDNDGVERLATTAYHGLQQVSTNTESQVRTEYRDVAGRLVKVKDPNGKDTQFAYDAFDNLTRTIDPNGNVISVSYDALGRKTQLNDPDLGIIGYELDPLGRVWCQISPEQRKAGGNGAPATLCQSGYASVMTYDALGRMTDRVEPDLSSHWVFDTATGKGVGQLAEAYTLQGAAKDYRRTYSYDPQFGRLLQTVTNLDDVYTHAQSYDAWGRLIQQTEQRGTDTTKRKVIDQRYNGYGYLYRLERQGLALWEAETQDAANRVTKANLGNGLVQNRAYSPFNGQLKSGDLVKDNQPNRLTESYVYDSIGNVTLRTQYWDQSGFDEIFHYDKLNRIDSSQVISEAQAVQQIFSYDDVGNLLSKTGVGSYTYPTQGAGVIRPHAVTNVSTLGNFSYDDNGNLKSGAGRQLSWTSFDMPKCITTGGLNADGSCASGTYSRFYYGPEHQRTKQDKSNGTTIFYAGAMEVEKTAAGAVRVKTYWPMGVGFEDDQPSQATASNWTHADRLGSIVGVTDEQGNYRQDSRMAYDAWGKRRTLDGAPINGTPTPNNIDGKPDNKGFTGHEMLDDLDLVHMNGRVYDPLVAKFMSGDPMISDPMNGQNYNRYSYVLNNPTNLTDPTGFEPVEKEKKKSNVPVDDKKLTACTAGCEVKDGNGNTVTVVYDAKTGEVVVVGASIASINTQVAANNGQGYWRQTNPGEIPGDGPNGATWEPPVYKPTLWDKVTDNPVGDFLGEVAYRAQALPGEGIVVRGAAKITGAMAGEALFKYEGWSLQRITNSVVRSFDEDASLARQFLSSKELAKGPHAANFGKAVERAVAEGVANSPILSRLVDYTSRPFVKTPDFVSRYGKGVYDVTTQATRWGAKHLERGYEGSLRLIEYVRPDGFKF